jgi:excisionase family DNA binding protein
MPSSTAQAERLSVTEAAEYLGVAVTTLYGWRTRQHGPRSAKVGRKLVYLRGELDRWLRDAQGYAGTRRRSA